MKNKTQSQRKVARLIFFIAILQLLVSSCSGFGIGTSERVISRNDPSFSIKLPAHIEFEDGDGEVIAEARMIALHEDQYFLELISESNNEVSLAPTPLFVSNLSEGWYVASVDYVSSRIYGQSHIFVGYDNTLEAWIDPARIDQKDIEAAAKKNNLNITGSIVSDPVKAELFLRFLNDLRGSIKLKDIKKARIVRGRSDQDYDKAFIQYGENLIRANGYLAHENSLNSTSLLNYFEFKASTGNAWGHYLLSRFYANGTGVEKADYKKARLHAEYAIKHDIAQANTVLGVLTRNGLGGLKKDVKHAIELYKTAADANDPRAMMNLATLYFEGDEVLKDSAQGVKWLNRALDEGLDFAAVELGRRYLYGEGVEKDSEKALKYLNEGYEHRNAKIFLGYMYTAGIGVEVDQKKASSYYLSAAEAGHSWAQWQYGERQISGTGTEADRGAGLRWIKIAAANGSEGAKEAEAKYAGEEKDTGIKLKRELEQVDSKLEQNKAELRKLCEEIREMCAGRICTKTNDGRAITQTTDGRYWYFKDGALAPKALWQDYSYCYE